MRTRPFLWVALSALVLVVTPAALLAAQAKPQAQPTAPAETDGSLFQQIQEAQDPASRLELVERFLAAYPQSPFRPYALIAGGEAHRMQNNFEKAVEFGEQALALEPNNAFALLLAGESLSEGSRPSQSDFQERLARAEDYSTRALKAIPMLFSPEKRKASPSPEEFDLREDYFESMAHATLGYVHFRRDELPAAEEELKLATELNQLRPNASDFERLGIVQAKQRKFDLARDTFSRCIEVGGPAADVCGRRIEMLDRVVEQEKAKEAEKPEEAEKPRE